MGIFKLSIRSQYMRGLPFLLRKDESQTVPQSIDTVQLWQFVIATLFILPRVLLQVFIGSRIAVLSDGKKTDSGKDSGTVQHVADTYSRHDDDKRISRSRWCYTLNILQLVRVLPIFFTWFSEHKEGLFTLLFRNI